MSYRRLWVLVSRLPMESWTQTILRDTAPDDALVAPTKTPEFGPWALVNYQLASMQDALRRLEYLTAVSGRLEPTPQPPEPTPRPGMHKRPRKQTAASVTYLKSLRAEGA